jgi:hypothetical protein
VFCAASSPTPPRKNQDKKKPGNVMRRGDFDASRPVHQRTIP